MGSYIISGLFGTTVNTTGTDAVFSCLQHMPASSASLGHLEDFCCYYNNNSTKPQIQGISVNITGMPRAYYPQDYHDFHTNERLYFSGGEYLIQVVMTRDNSISTISSIRFRTSVDKTLFMGTSRGDTMAFTAPENWRIVGFHGTAGSYVTEGGVTRYPITKLGVVYISILP